MKQRIVLLLIPAVFSFAAFSCKPKQIEDTSTPAAPETAKTQEPEKPPTTQDPALPQPTNDQPPEILKVGDTVTLDAIQSATWIQGEAPTSFEPGHIYIFECWATWCGPCIRSIPHLNQLHEKYNAKGLHLHGIHIFERGDADAALEKATAFVKKQGDGMKYPVAFAAKDSMFTKQWVRPAKVGGIPHAFVVIDGKIRFMGHPAYLKEEMIEGLLNGDEMVQKQFDSLVKALGEAKTEQQLTGEYRKAIASRDALIMEALLEKIEKEHPDSNTLPMLQADILIARESWDAVEAMITDPAKRGSLGYLCSRVGLPSGMVENIPPELTKKLSASYTEMIQSLPQVKAPALLALSGLQHRAGDTDAAKASAAKAMELANSDPKSAGLPLPVFQQFKQALDSGSMPSAQEFNSWLNSSRGKRANQ